jgi:hypothetical protein
VATLAVLTGCGQVVAGTPKGESTSDADRALIAAYFEQNNEAAGEGAAAQREFLARTQHPDFDDEACNLGELTLTIAPTLSTLRPDAGWQPLNTDRTPRGRIYIIAVAVTVLRGTAPVGTQIGSIHVVVLDGKAHGFAPCPA